MSASTLSSLTVAACAVLALSPRPAAAQYEPFIGQIMCVGWNFTPRGWLPTDGRLLPINTNQALFSLLGTQYGGNGETNFALPDLRGRSIVGTGSGPGLTPRIIGEQFGSEQHTLTLAQLPPHRHAVSQPASTATANLTSPAGNVPAVVPGSPHYTGKNNAPTRLANINSAATGGGQPVGHLPPSLALPCFIAVQGVFPSFD